MLDLARAQGIRLPAETPAALADAMAVEARKNLEEYSPSTPSPCR